MIKAEFQLTAEQLHTMQGMSKYWEEISRRDEPLRSHIASVEVENLLAVAKPLQILMIIAEHVNQPK